MIKVEHLLNAEIIYKPSQQVEDLVCKIADLLDSTHTNHVFFNKPLTMGELQARMVEREDSHSVLLVHWIPRRDISTTDDPYCSGFILTQDELSIIYDEIKRTISF